MQMGNNVHTIILTNLTFPAPQSISFYGIMPEEFTETHSTIFEQIDIKSRSNPLASYAGSTSRTVDISVDIHEDYLAEFNGGRADIRDFVAAVRSITYPQYQGTIVIPPRVLIRIGNFFKLKGYCNSCSVTWKKPIRNGRFISATLSFSLSEALEQSYTAAEVFTKEDLRRV